MKNIFFLILICLIPFYLKAQDSTLGKTKDQIRAMVKPYPAIKLSPGDNTDTLTMQGDLKTIVRYKNNVCYASESILPLKVLDMVTQKMTKDGFKKVKDNLWISGNGTIKVELIIDQKTNHFITETTNSASNSSK